MTNNSSTQLDPVWVDLLMQARAQAMPGGAAAAEENLAFARLLFEAMQPADAAEAALAARAIAAHAAAMDGFARAARPGLSDETVIKLRTNALAAGRVYDSACRTLKKNHAVADSKAAKPAAPEPAGLRSSEARPSPAQRTIPVLSHSADPASASVASPPRAAVPASG